ncbi:glycosyltransferase family 9 protein [Rahnella sikkimica]|uniref:Glycosyl transferase n=1 Tax=Rahnella sikkimica TaxID=1805933 RepID=A0A2L1UMV6_9GAMM|nr:glycosyltransferase family 9 protein [Rahnella sikkimica]AVF34158.1 glycosyl transferase [Rahnella sikkimica]
MKILIIRRENIGDLILTTPLISMLAKNHHVDMLVNSYNKQVLDGNPGVSKVHHYTKLHHENSYTEKIKAILRRITTILTIWREGYDVAIVAGNWNKRPLQWATLSRAKRIIAIGNDAPDSVTDKIPYMHDGMHMVEQMAELARPLNCHAIPGKLALWVTKSEREFAAHKIKNTYNFPLYGLQISSRKEQQRWPVENYIEIAHRLSREEPCKIILFWSPGSADNQRHPGDDEKAQYIINACKDIIMVPFNTVNIRELMAGMSLCNQIITSDGGALHIAAGVGKPVVALFGNSDPLVWGPWKVPNRIIASADEDVAHISTDEVYDNFMALRKEVLIKIPKQSI